MTTDATRLLAALQSYSEALERHFVVLRERHEQLTSYWAPTHDLYRGAGAEAFAEAMERANARFVETIETGGLIQTALKARIDELSRFDSATTPEL